MTTGELSLASKRARCACATCSSRGKPSSITLMTSAMAGSIGLTVTDVRAGQRDVSYPRYIGGERNGPPEDCGGIPGFYELLEAIVDRTPPSHAHLKEWAADYDPDPFHALPLKCARARSANPPNAAKARLARKKHLGSPA